MFSLGKFEGVDQTQTFFVVNDRETFLEKSMRKKNNKEKNNF